MLQAFTRSRSGLNALSQCRGSVATLVSRPNSRVLPSSVTRGCPQKRTYSNTKSLEYEQDPTRRTRSSKKPDATQFTSHLNNLFSPLQFPPELAARILTHASHPDAVVSHNARLSFIGRRVLKTYLLLYLHSSPALQDTHDYQLIIDRTLNSYVLGEHVAPKWSLGRVLKWSPANIDPRVTKPGSDFSALEPDVSRGVGLYKVQGTTVEAVIGGIFHEFGGSVAHQVFHTRLLPHILLPGQKEGLHDAFHAHALEICEKMGGMDAAVRLPRAPEGSVPSEKSESGPAISTHHS